MAHSYMWKFPIFVLLLLGYPFYSTCIFQNSKIMKWFQIASVCSNDERTSLVNGQLKPLSQTLENFISLVEKFEDANPDLNLDQTLYILLKNYTQDNLEKVGDKLTRIAFDTNLIIASSLENEWDPQPRQPPNHVNPFSLDEQCSLFYMLSHTVDDSSVWDEEESQVFYSTNGKQQAPKKTKFPREVGTVLIRSSGDSVALGPVIMGLYSGINNREIPLRPIVESTQNEYNIEGEPKISLLHTLTLSDVLLFSQWRLVFRKQMKESLGQDGEFRDFFVSQINGQIVQTKTSNNICPTLHFPGENQTSLYTYSLIRGAADGLILGQKIKLIFDQKNEVRVSQILRSYYTRQGIIDPVQETSSERIRRLSFCQRSELLSPDLLATVYKQMEYELAALASDYPQSEQNLMDAQNEFANKKGDIFKLEAGWCKAKPEELQSETLVDVVIVLDSASDDVDLKLQQELVGYLANNLEIQSGGSTSFSVYIGNTELKELVPQTNSSAEVACAVIQSNLTPKENADRSNVIRSIDNLLKKKKENITMLTGTFGIVLVYLNFQDKETSGTVLDTALNNLHRGHIDIPIYAVGRNTDVLNKYAGGNNQRNVKLVSDSGVKDLSNELAKLVANEPAALQYSDCENGRDEKSALYQGQVSRGSVQYWSMDPKYFEKSFTAKFIFEGTAGDIQVCHNRVKTKPGYVAANCRTTNSKDRSVEFSFKDPCIGLTRFTCSSIHFTVAGLNETDGNNLNRYCTDSECKALDQVKFKLSHEGVRCSGCCSLLSTSSLLFVSLLLTYLFITQDK